MPRRVVCARRDAYVCALCAVCALGAFACSKPAERAEPPAQETAEAPPAQPTPDEAEPGTADPGSEANPEQAQEQAAQAPPTPAVPIVVKSEFATPESVLHDVEADLYLVSNINGAPLDADGNGFISRLDVEGKVTELKWITGEKEGTTLNAPKGMAIAAGTLYVADINTVRKFDAKTGEPKGDVAIEGATFLNDVIAGQGDEVYVSDSGLKAGKQGFEPSGTDAIYKISGDKVETLAKGDELGRPNGLLLDGTDLYAVTYGSNELYKVVDGKKAEIKQLPKGSLDGLLKVKNGSLLISSWEGSSVIGAIGEAPPVEVLKDLDAPADIGYDEGRNRILVPLFNKNEVHLIPLQMPES